MVSGVLCFPPGLELSDFVLTRWLISDDERIKRNHKDNIGHKIRIGINREGRRSVSRQVD